MEEIEMKEKELTPELAFLIARRGIKPKTIQKFMEKYEVIQKKLMTKSTKYTRDNLRTRAKFLPFLKQKRDERGRLVKWKEFHQENIENLTKGLPAIRIITDRHHYGVICMNIGDFNHFLIDEDYTIGVISNWAGTLDVKIYVPGSIMNLYLGIYGSTAHLRAPRNIENICKDCNKGEYDPMVRHSNPFTSREFWRCDNCGAERLVGDLTKPKLTFIQKLKRLLGYGK